ncbi:MAG: thioredoxin family protein [Tannerella sp.]|jgi:hypothetical protein|nr:thioredoxin family protein [Tannerella sp.]
MQIKTCVLFGLTAVLLFLSAGSEKASFTEGFRPGNRASRIEYGESNLSVDFSNRTGHYTLLNFWAAYDAVSRVHNMQLWRKISALDSTRITLFSISMDENFSVYAETLKADKLDTTNQFYAGRENKSSLYKKYGLKDGFKNFLIDDKGVIVAANVTAEELSNVK